MNPPQTYQHQKTSVTGSLLLRIITCLSVVERA